MKIQGFAMIGSSGILNCLGKVNIRRTQVFVTMVARLLLFIVRWNRVGNSSLLGHCPFGLDVNLIFKVTEASWEGTKATFHPSPRAPRPV